ncbi:mannosyltransferase putative-domain-containing protein, partial [Zopfochytrium polystomum]
MIESDNDNDNDATVATAAAMAGSTPAATATTTTTAWWSTVTTTSTTSTIAVRAPAAAAANKPPLPPPSLAPTPDAAVAVLVQPEKETSSSSSSSFSSSWSPPSPSSPSSAGSSFLDSDSAPSTPTTLSPSPPSHQKPVPKFPSPSPHSRKSGRAASHLESTPSSPPTPTLPPASVPVIPPLDEDALRQREKWLRFLDTPQPYDGDHGRTVRGSRGIVYTGTDATVKHLLVSVLFLRDFGCSLPIEFVSYNVSLVDMQEDLKNVDWGPEEWKFGAAKVSAIIHSTFQEVLFMDPDNMVMRDPTYLFSTNRFKTYGALFWPDYFRRKKDIPMWEIFDIPLGDRGKDELEFESGQIVVDKERAWNGLKAAEFISSEAKYYFK